MGESLNAFGLSFTGGDSVLSSSMLTDSQSVNLLSVDFLCRLCQCSDEAQHSSCMVADLVRLIDCEGDETWSSTKVFDAHLVCKHCEVVVYFDHNVVVNNNNDK